MRKIFYLLTAAAAVLGLALGGASAASASTASPAAHAAPAGATEGSYAGTEDGDAGYVATGLGVIYKQGAATFTIKTADEALGSTTSLADPAGALGMGGCNNGTGQAAEIGLLNLKTGGFTIADAIGTLGANNADPCINNGILTNGNITHPLLENLPVGENVTIEYIEYARGVGFYVSLNSGPDINTGEAFSYYDSFATKVWVPGRWVDCHDGKHGRVCTWKRGHWKTTYPHPVYNEALNGAMADASLLGGTPVTDLVDFTGVNANDLPLGVLGTVRPVFSSADGVAPWLIGPAGDNADGTTTAITACPGATSGPLGEFGTAFSLCAATNVGA
jgi:hypothetical protein